MAPKVEPSVQALADLSLALEGDYSERDRSWAGSPFAWIKTRPSRQIGTIGERLVERYLQRAGFRVSPSSNSDADRVVDGKRVEIKFSSLWEGGFYKFQQLRDQNYDLALCLGV